MMKYQELSDPNSCLNKAADDEPLFVLRSTDKLAPALVRLWADLAAAHGCAEEKVRDAVLAAERMELWALNNMSKWPD
jgi:hypothetical protein